MNDRSAADDAAAKRATAASFDAAADAYLESDTHREGADLDRLVSWCDGAERALDVATGVGHTAGALLEAGVPTVVATDASTEMLVTTRAAYPGVRVAVADAERLSLAADAVDAVTCRIAAHHFPRPRAFVDEVARVARPGATFAFEDLVAPEDDSVAAVLDAVERARDPSHVASHPTDRWRSWLEDAGFVVEAVRHHWTTLQFDAWTEAQSLSPARRDEVESLLLDAPAAVRSALDVVVADGAVESFANRKASLRATLPE